MENNYSQRIIQIKVSEVEDALRIEEESALGKVKSGGGAQVCVIKYVSTYHT